MQKFSLHDGPGIRTTVFLKGCPLRCSWCCNPESQALLPVRSYDKAKCLGHERCGLCIRACPHKALQPVADGSVQTNRSLCRHCGGCAKVCTGKAALLLGYTISVAQLIDEISKDFIFYHYSGGGISLSGGEPLLQPEFAMGVLAAAQRIGLTTTMETCAHIPYAHLFAACAHLDSIFIDLKTMDARVHKRVTGQGNALILSNVEKILSDYPRLPLTCRMPVVPGVNDSVESVRAVGEFLSQRRNVTLELLAYHPLGSCKYRFLGIEYALENIKPPTTQHMEELRSIAAQYVPLAQHDDG